jgi:hypothetical protein
MGGTESRGGQRNLPPAAAGRPFRGPPGFSRRRLERSRETSKDEFKSAFIIAANPDHHVERVREIEQLGATIVCLQNTSGADPLGALRMYGEKVLPALRGAPVR